MISYERNRRVASMCNMGVFELGLLLAQRVRHRRLKYLEACILGAGA